MNVKKLIEHLQKFPEDSEVLKLNKGEINRIPTKIMMIKKENNILDGMPVANLNHLTYLGFTSEDDEVKEVIII